MWSKFRSPIKFPTCLQYFSVQSLKLQSFESQMCLLLHNSQWSRTKTWWSTVPVTLVDVKKWLSSSVWKQALDSVDLFLVGNPDPLVNTFFLHHIGADLKFHAFAFLSVLHWKAYFSHVKFLPLLTRVLLFDACAVHSNLWLTLGDLESLLNCWHFAASHGWNLISGSTFGVCLRVDRKL